MNDEALAALAPNGPWPWGFLEASSHYTNIQQKQNICWNVHLQHMGLQCLGFTKKCIKLIIISYTVASFQILFVWAAAPHLNLGNLRVYKAAVFFIVLQE